MSTHTRVTHECTLGDMRPNLANAIDEHIEVFKLGSIKPSVLICCETISTHPKTGLFAHGDETIATAMVVTTQLLIWTSEKEQSKPVVTSALLRNINAHDFENTAMCQVKPDSGINITGRYTDVTKQGQSFIGLGPNPAGEKFRQVLQHAIQKAQS